MASDYGVYVEVDSTVADAIKNDLLRRILEACKASGETTTTTFAATFSAGGSPNVKVVVS